MDLSLIKIFEKVINEIRYDDTNLSEDIVLFKLDDNTLVLYDVLYYDDSDRFGGIKAMISLNKHNDDMEVNRVAALKGYGPLIYELGMQSIYPKKLVSARDGDTRESALNVLEKFITLNNTKVDVITLDETSNEYVDCLDFGCSDDMPMFFKVYNSKFSCKPTTSYKKLIREGKEFLNDVGKDFLKEINEMAIDFFSDMYR